MSFYSNMADTALLKIRQFGQELPIRRVTRSHNPVTGETTETVESSGSVQALVLDPEAKDRDLVDEEVCRVTAAAKGAPFKPRPRDLVVIDSVAWEIISCSALAPAGVPVLYNIVAKLA